MPTYKTGEEPEYGDVVKGTPNNSTLELAGLVAANYEGMLCIVYLVSEGVKSDEWGPRRCYGHCTNFVLLHRNGGA